MALKSTVFKATVSLSNMDAHLYKDIHVTIAQHPSETDERMMVRLLAFVLNDQERLTFGRGLSNEEEPAIYVKTLTDDIQLWIDVGLPDKERIKKASHKAEKVIIYSYGGNNADTWWQQNKNIVSGYKNVKVIKVPTETSINMAELVERTMHLSCNVQDGTIWLSSDSLTIEIQMQSLL
ncbi:MAG: YaeQ family protein [Pseudomonadales bacterium]|nr:YaeQ family protein [Pseudomonadales bacterium]